MTYQVILPGLQGDNPLAFLAALGTLRIAAVEIPEQETGMSWQPLGGGWSPALHFRSEVGEDRLAEILHQGLKKMSGHPAFGFADDLNVTAEAFREENRRAARSSTSGNRIHADFLAAFGFDGLTIDEKTPQIQDTALRTMSGAGHQHFLGFMRELVETTDATHLKSALFAPWSYCDEKPSMRWDPQDDRRYALRWKEPAGDPVRTMRGANRLAIEALPLLPTAARGRYLHTTGFSQRKGEGVFFTWPLWEPAIGPDVVRSLLAFGELQEPTPERGRLHAMGVVEVYRSQRITQGKYRNFAPGHPV